MHADASHARHLARPRHRGLERLFAAESTVRRRSARLRRLLGLATLLGGFGMLGNRILKDGKLPEFSLPKMAWLTREQARVEQAVKQAGGASRRSR